MEGPDLWENEHVREQVRRLAAELMERKTIRGRVARELLFPATVTQTVN